MKRLARRRACISLERLEARSVPTTLIALIDSGVDLTDPNDLPYYDFTNAYDAYNKRTAAQYGNGVVQDTSQQHGHGSTVADLIVRAIRDTKAQPGAGAADVKIMPIRDTSINLSIDDSSMIRGVYWAADHGAAVVNLSIRQYNNDFFVTDSSDPHYGSSLSQAIQYAQTKGVVVVTAPGNEQSNIDTPFRYVMPAASDDPNYNGLNVALDNLLVAAAVDSSGNLTSASNWGPIHVDLGAYSNSEGLTSYSSGYASGVTGVIAALTPSWTAAQRVNHIKGTVTPHTQSVGAWSTTGGNINPAGAVQALNLAAPPLTATSLGQDGHDYIGSGAGSTGPDGYQDIHITLTGLPSSKTISWIDVTGLGAGEWRYNGAYGSDKAVLVNYAAGGTTADLYLQPYQNETGRPFTVTVFYTDSTSANGTTNLVYATAHLPMPSGLVDRTNETGGTITARGENGAGEGAAKAFDNNINTKWLDLSGNSWIQYQFANNAAYVITQYTLTSAADTASYPGRAPKSWVLKGSNDGVTWTTLDTRTNQADTANLDTRTYNFNNTTAYKMYRLDNIVSNGDSIIQLAEFRLLGP